MGNGARAAVVLAFAAASLAMGTPEHEGYRSQILRWRQEREAGLRADGGWLTVAGLFWLKEGPNAFGADRSNDLVLPPGAAPARAGVFELRQGKVSVRVEPGAGVTLDGKPVEAMELRSDTSGSPDVLSLGRLSLHLIDRGGRLGIRLKDRDSRMRHEFAGLKWFPVRESHRVAARFVAYDPPKRIPIANILGQVEDLPSPGYAVFQMEGREVRLEPVLEQPGATELFFIFRDRTSGTETYRAGRFLYADLPMEGKVVLDFNKAYSPPCAFTPYATCPLPPRQNDLPVRIEAGEKADRTH